jgi:hypothetical protein
MTGPVPGVTKSATIDLADGRAPAAEASGSRLVAKRLLLTRRDDDARLRVVHLGPGPTDVWLWRLETKEWPLLHHLAALQDQLDAGMLAYGHESTTVVASTADGKAAEYLERRRAVLAPLLLPEVYPSLMAADLRGRLLVETAARHGVSWQFVAKVLRLWWAKGMTGDALVTGFRRCGGAGKARRNTGPKVGRPRRLTTEVGVNATPEVRRHLQIATDLHLTSGLTQAQALDQICSKFYCVEVTNGKGAPRMEVVPERPTIDQLGYFVRSNYPEHVRRRLRLGEKVYLGSARPTLGRADGDVIGAGDRFEIDATIADVYLVSERDPLAIVGRPVIYAMVDTHSRLIVAVYVGFEGPSWVGAMMCLVNMVTPKVAFCGARGIDIAEAEWPCHLAPSQIMADRGELMSIRLGHRIVDELGIGITHVTAYRGDLKGIIERRHRTLPVIFKPFVAGYVEADHGIRGVRDYRLDAALTLPEFEQMVIRSVLIHNTTPVSGIEVDSEMVRAGLTSAPADRWAWSLENHGHRLHALTPEKVALEVMPEETARVTGRGIKFKGGFYDCDLANREEWYDRARRESWTESVAFDPRDLGTVYLKNARMPQGYERLRLLPPSEDRAGVSLYEVEKLDLERKVVERAGQAERQNRRIEHAGAMDGVADVAERRRDDALALTKRSKASRTKAIRDNKAREKADRRPSETIRLGEGPAPRPRAEVVPAVPPRPSTEPPAAVRKPTSRMDRVNSLLGRSTR